MDTPTPGQLAYEAWLGYWGPGTGLRAWSELPWKLQEAFEAAGQAVSP